MVTAVSTGRDVREAPVIDFAATLDAAVTRHDSLVCVGLDPDQSRMPVSAWDPRDATGSLVRFNAAIIEATADLVCAYKPNLGFYAAAGVAGIEALVATRELIPGDIPVILDCKVGDLGNTAAAYARAYFDEWGFDAVTANPYLGEDSLAPFLSYPSRGVFILCKTSNPGSGELQDLVTGDAMTPLYLTLAERAKRWAKDYPATVGLVVGATYPAQLGDVRATVGELPILVPGIGTQAGDVSAAVAQGLDSGGAGLIVTASRAITYAGSGDDFAEQARQAATRFRDQINVARESARMETNL